MVAEFMEVFILANLHVFKILHSLKKKKKPYVSNTEFR